MQFSWRDPKLCAAMPEDKLAPADPNDVAAALAFALPRMPGCADHPIGFLNRTPGVRDDRPRVGKIVGHITRGPVRDSRGRTRNGNSADIGGRLARQLD